MSYIDLLQELGRARRALEDLIAATSGPGTKDLLTKRDAITTAMNRVADDRVGLGPVDVTAAVSALDDVAAKLASLVTTTKDISKAVALADTATATTDAVLTAVDQRTSMVTASSAARTLLAIAPPDGQRFTAFCNTHNVEIPPTKVTLSHAMQNEADHLALIGNADDNVQIILVK